MNRNNLSTFSFEVYDFLYLAKRLILLSLPFVLAFSFIFIVDPYNYFGYSKLIPDETKAPIALIFNPTFWKLNKFEKEPKANVLLGDSRMIAMEPEFIKEVSGEDYSNMAYGGGNMRESVETFWILSKQIPLKKIYISINLDKYNDYEITNRTTFYASTRENKFLYFLNYDVWSAAYHNSDIFLSGRKLALGKPNMTKDDFWAEGVAVETKYYEKYAEPNKYRAELNKISEYCQANNIELTFVIFPTHIDLQRVLDKTNMREKREEMVRDLVKWGKVYDFDWENEMTVSKDNYTDPFHFTEDIAKNLVNEIWGNQIKYAKVYPREN